MTKPSRPHTLIVCINRRFRSDKGSCADKGSEALADALERGIADRKIDISLERIRCLGECGRGPSMRLAPGGKFYFRVQPQDVMSLLDELESVCGHRPDEKKNDGPVAWPGS